jgi:hypothetical protein
MERLIDSFTEGLIEKDQFTSRMARTKSRITDLDAKIKVGAGNVDQLEHLRLATTRLRELAGAVTTAMQDVHPSLCATDPHRHKIVVPARSPSGSILSYKRCRAQDYPPPTPLL